jgi:hypothetical protein
MMPLFDYIAAAVRGPGAFRFVIQPLLAVILGIRDGVRDARTGRPPYFLQLLGGGARGRDMLRAGVRQIVVPLCIGIALDIVLRFSLGFGFHPLSSVIVGALLIGLPYSLARGAANRMMQLFRRK